MTACPRDTVVLDMDGTLLDLNFDDQVWNHALPAALAARDRCALDTARARVAEKLGSARGTLPWYCLDHWEREFGISVHDLEVEMAHFIDVRTGTREFLEFLRDKRVRAVLATNAHPASLARKMVRTGLGGYFDALVSAHTLGAAKEDPAFWRRLSALHAVVPEASIFVDDNQAVLDTARRCGVRHVFGVRTPSSRGESKHFENYASIDSLAELIPWLARRHAGVYCS
ncbi:MAG: GMP/IMP nucleotidase [Gammaproteobacteria bacterium]